MLVDEIRRLSESVSSYNKRFEKLTKNIEENLRRTASEGNYAYTFTVKCESGVIERLLNDLRNWVKENGFGHEYTLSSDSIKIYLNWSK